MNPLLKFKKHLVKKLELGILLIILLYYSGPNVPTPVTKIWALFVYLMVPLLIIGNWRRFIWVATQDLLPVLLTGYAVISVLWSTNPESTLACSRALLISTSFGIYLATRYTPKEQMRILVWFLSIYMVLSLMASLGHQGAWMGISHYKNVLALMMAITATLFLDIYLYTCRYRWVALIVSGIAFVILVLSQGKGSLGVFIGLLVILPLYKVIKQEYRLKTILAICFFSISVALAIATFINLELIVVDFLGKTMTFHGRTQIWTYLIERGSEKTWLGYGYGGFWANPTESLGVALNTWLDVSDGKGNAHNVYLEIFLQLGLPGFSLIAVSLLTVLTRIFILIFLTKQIEFFWMLQYTIIIAITGFFDYMGLLGYRDLFWVLYVFISYSTAIQLNRIFKTGNKLVNLQFEKKQ